METPCALNPARSKKKAQLGGLDPGTAAARLRSDLLWGFVAAAHPACCRCGGPLTRATYSIDHLEAWLDSADPLRLFFDPGNIGYSHLVCNIADARRPNRHTDQDIAAMSPERQKAIAKARRKQAVRRPRPVTNR